MASDDREPDVDEDNVDVDVDVGRPTARLVDDIAESVSYGAD